MLSLRSRGQMLPFWAMAIAMTCILAVVGLQYGEILLWQVRAQNAADAAAAGALSVQTANWNEQILALYAASIEEWRIRNLMTGLMLSWDEDTSCGGTWYSTTSASGCVTVFNGLRNAYMAAVNRYGVDVQIENRLSQYTAAGATADATALVASFQSSCGTSKGGDCAFDYTVTGIEPRSDTGSLNTVEMGANAYAVNMPGQSASPSANYTPLQIEVVACATVPPLFPSFLGLSLPTFTAVGRAAATSAMVTQEWLQPGTIVNPATNQPFQQQESYDFGITPNLTNNPYGTYDWFQVPYGGSPAAANPATDTYSETFNGAEYSFVTGWWSTIPVTPFTGSLSQTNYQCASPS